MSLRMENNQFRQLYHYIILYCPLPSLSALSVRHCQKEIAGCQNVPMSTKVQAPGMKHHPVCVLISILVPSRSYLWYVYTVLGHMHSASFPATSQSSSATSVFNCREITEFVQILGVRLDRSWNWWMCKLGDFFLMRDLTESKCYSQKRFQEMKRWKKDENGTTWNCHNAQLPSGSKRRKKGSCVGNVWEWYSTVFPPGNSKRPCPRQNPGKSR